ncbi:MAG TPA: hypothetical protein VMR33_09505 [Candidatus Baltobacteraceae bacterium]|jgi:hypothetical protein|nr:hypothetical protein [Candidatus Baltobacteraceae bacterium]
MSNCATPSQLQQLGEAAVAEFDSRIAEIPLGLCAAFQIEAMRLQDQLLIIQRLIALCARDEDDLDKVAALWAFMVGICDLFAERLFRLKGEHPSCGAEQYYDRILDLRNKCHRLHQMHR